MKTIEYDAKTGIVTEREITEEEIAQIEDIENYKPTNEDIQKLRQEAYKERSDSLYIACKKYEMLGLTEKAEAAKQMWLDEIERINDEFPYK